MFILGYFAFLLARYFAQRAFCALAIFRRAAALITRLLPDDDTAFSLVEPFKLLSKARAWFRLAISLSISCRIFCTLIDVLPP